MKAKLLSGVLVMVALSAGVIAPAMAQQRDNDQIRSLRAQVRDVTRLQREAELARQAAERASAEASEALVVARSRADELAGGQEGARARAVNAEREVARLKAKLVELEVAATKRDEIVRQTQDELGRQRVAGAATQDRLQSVEELLGQCRSDNAVLATTASELLDAYEGKGVGAILGETEPFTGIGRVRLEVLKERYSEKIEAATLRAESRQ